MALRTMALTSVHSSLSLFLGSEGRGGDTVRPPLHTSEEAHSLTNPTTCLVAVGQSEKRWEGIRLRMLLVTEEAGAGSLMVLVCRTTLDLGGRGGGEPSLLIFPRIKALRAGEVSMGHEKYYIQVKSLYPLREIIFCFII